MRDFLIRAFNYDGDLEYRKMPFVANSDLKEIRDRYYGKSKPDNLEQIFDFGNLFDALVLQPHKANMEHHKLEKAMTMKRVLFQDKTIAQIFRLPDLRRQHEFYKRNVNGVIGAKCMCDGDSKLAGLIFELKGLAVSNEKQFEEAIDHLDYDQACAWYLDVAAKKDYLIAAGSKTKEVSFKRYINRDHAIYKRGAVKVTEAVKIWKNYGFI